MCLLYGKLIYTHGVAWINGRIETITRLEPTKDTLNLLFSLCDNICAFPDCSHPVFDAENTFIAQICHIECAKERGWKGFDEKDSKQIKAALILVKRMNNTISTLRESFDKELRIFERYRKDVHKSIAELNKQTKELQKYIEEGGSLDMPSRPVKHSTAMTVGMVDTPRKILS